MHIRNRQRYYLSNDWRNGPSFKALATMPQKPRPMLSDSNSFNEQAVPDRCCLLLFSSPAESTSCSPICSRSITGSVAATFTEMLCSRRQMLNIWRYGNYVVTLRLQAVSGSPEPQAACRHNSSGLVSFWNPVKCNKSVSIHTNSLTLRGCL